MNNEYLTEQELTDRYGDMIMKKVATSVYKRCCSKDEQIKGADYLFPRRADIKFDYYKNDNIVIEIKMCASIAIIFTKEELREFTKTETYKKRISIRAKNSCTVFKNFHLNEISDSRKRIIKLNINFDIIGKESKEFIYNNEG